MIEHLHDAYERLERENEARREDVWTKRGPAEECGLADLFHSIGISFGDFRLPREDEDFEE